MRATIASFVSRNYRVLFYKAQQRFQTPTGRATCDVKKKEELSISSQWLSLSRPSFLGRIVLKKTRNAARIAQSNINSSAVLNLCARFRANQSKVPLSHSTTHFLGGVVLVAIALVEAIRKRRDPCV
jgi:hypothetical protein